MEFQAAVLEHLEYCGLDSIAYLEDPAQADVMIPIVTHHTKFTMKSAQDEAARLEAEYDKYDVANVEDAKLFVRNSLSKELAKELNQVTKDVTTFIRFWMLLMDVVHVASSDHFEVIA